MRDKTPVQADGQDTAPGPDDLANDKRGSTESDGGAYPNPHTGKDAGGTKDSGRAPHGGQSHIDYSGPDNPNAATGKD